MDGEGSPVRQRVRTGHAAALGGLTSGSLQALRRLETGCRSSTVPPSTDQPSPGERTTGP